MATPGRNFWNNRARNMNSTSVLNRPIPTNPSLEAERERRRLKQEEEEEPRQSLESSHGATSVVQT